MSGETKMTLDYVSTMYLGKIKDGYAQRKCGKKLHWHHDVTGGAPN